MKKILIIINIIVGLFNITATASNELTEIKELLVNGTIDNYESILIPLRGDPEGFNITSTDDLKTIEFGEGVEGYTVDFKKLERALRREEKNVSPYLIKNNKYYFSIKVSERDVAEVEIIKNEQGYRVFCVRSGVVLEKYIKEKNGNNAKYVTYAAAINGFVRTNGNKESFFDLNSMETVEGNIVEEFINRYNIISGLETPEKKNYGKTGVVIVVVMIALIVILHKRKRQP